MKRLILICSGLLLMYMVGITAAQGMPDYVIRTAQEINARYGEGTIDINNAIWDWREGAIGDGFDLTAGCTSPMTLPATTSATKYYRVFFNGEANTSDGWTVVVYNDYSYFGFCTMPRYQCGTLEPRLTIGGRGHVKPDGFPNNMRAQPGESGQLIGEIPAGGEFSVLEGPYCASGISFWRVDHNGAQGWTAEGQGTDYFVNPGSVPTTQTDTSTAINPTATPPTGPTPIPTYTCGGVRSRLYVGLKAQVTPGLPNNIRAVPGESGQYLGEIPPGVPFDVVGGPECNSNILWWQVNYQGTIGWTGEAGSPDDYWLEPLFATTASPINVSTINRLTQVASLSSGQNAPPRNLYITARNEIAGTWEDHAILWVPTDPNLLASDLSWITPTDNQLPSIPMSEPVEVSDQWVRLYRSLSSHTTIDMAGGLYFGQYDLGIGSSTLDVGAIHPTGDMLVLSPHGLGFVFVDTNETSVTYQNVIQRERIMLPNETYRNLKFSGNGQRLVGQTDAGNFVLWQGADANPANWNMLYPIITDDSLLINDFTISQDGSKLVIVGSKDEPTTGEQHGFYTLYNLTDTGVVEVGTTYYSLTHPLTTVRFTPDDSLFVIPTHESMIQFIDSNTLAIVHTAELLNLVTEVAFNDNGTLLAMSDYTGTLTVWKVSG